MADSSPQKVIRVSTNILFGMCEEEGCDFGFKEDVDQTDFEVKVNHYLQEHGYKLLHVGQETSNDMDGNPWQETVAILGKP